MATGAFHCFSQGVVLSAIPDVQLSAESAVYVEVFVVNVDVGEQNKTQRITQAKDVATNGFVARTCVPNRVATHKPRSPACLATCLGSNGHPKSAQYFRATNYIQNVILKQNDGPC